MRTANVEHIVVPICSDQFLGTANLEAHGVGLNTLLHAHLNHFFNPNISLRHLDQRNALSRITILVHPPIKVGDELSVTYVNPKLGYKRRQDDSEMPVSYCNWIVLKVSEALASTYFPTQYITRTRTRLIVTHHSQSAKE